MCVSVCGSLPGTEMCFARTKGSERVANILPFYFLVPIFFFLNRSLHVTHSNLRIPERWSSEESVTVFIDVCYPFIHGGRWRSSCNWWLGRLHHLAADHTCLRQTNHACTFSQLPGTTQQRLLEKDCYEAHVSAEITATNIRNIKKRATQTVTV